MHSHGVAPPRSPMASHLQLLLLLVLLSIKSLASESIFPQSSILVGVTKDVGSLQYTAQLLVGNPRHPVKLVVDLSGQSLWLNCAPSSSSQQFIRHGTLQCSTAKSSGRSARTGFDHKRTTAVCDVRQANPVTGATGLADLAEDIVSVDGMDSVATVDRFLFSCVPDYLLKGLASGAKGMLGLGMSAIAFPSQLVNNFGLSRKFAVCLSSSDGFLISGTGISKALSYTPLVAVDGRSSDEYHVNVNSIKINGKRLALGDGGQGAQISTTVPYTTMKSTVYEVFTKAYVKAAASMNMTMVTPVAPFGVCFSSDGVRTTASGPTVPNIELVLQSEMVKWRIEGRNSMVRVNDAVMCLGFLDGGLDTSNSVVVGGYQLEDRILEFHLGTRMLGFGAPMEGGTSCSTIRASVSTGRELL